MIRGKMILSEHPAMRDHEGRRLAKVTRRQNWIPVRLVTFMSAAGGRVARAGIEMPIVHGKGQHRRVAGIAEAIADMRVQSPASAGAAAPDLRALRVRVALCRGRWAAPDVPFPAVTDLTLQPGETYEYRGTRAIYLPGAYFLEPVQQSTDGKWGGVPPFTCVDLTVSPAR